MARTHRHAACALLCTLLAVAGCGAAPASGRLTPVAHRVTSEAIATTPVGGQGGGEPAAAPAPAGKPAPSRSRAAKSPDGTPPKNAENPSPPARPVKPAGAAAGAAVGAAEAAVPGPTGPHSTIRTTTGNDTVALTFDDGPSPYTPQILALLRANGIKATFCLIGVNVRAYPDYVRAIVADGHTLCNHTWSHDLKLGTRSPERIRADLQRTNDEIHRIVPDAPIKYFRHPGGNFTPRATAIASELGMVSISWDVDPWDWNTKAYPPGPTMTNHVIGTVERQTHAGSIVLSHDGGGVRGSTIEAYRTLLPWLRARFTLAKLPT